MGVHRLVVVAATLAGTSACGGDGASNPFDTANTGISATRGSASGDGTAESGVTGGPATQGGSVGEESDGGPKLDVQAGDVPGPCVGEGCNEGCTGVDLLFVIDNSVSMGDYQAALGLAFPAFASTLDTALPAGTSLHVGVTSTDSITMTMAVATMTVKPPAKMRAKFRFMVYLLLWLGGDLF